MKTKEELNQLKAECETLTAKLNELTEDELNMVTGGGNIPGLEAIGPTSIFSILGVKFANDRIMRDAKISEINNESSN